MECGITSSQILLATAGPASALITGGLLFWVSHCSSKAEDRRQNRKRQTIALEELYNLLEDQSNALREYWGVLSSTVTPEDLPIPLTKAWHILHDKRYRAKLWAARNSDIIPPINGYAETMHDLFNDYRILRDSPGSDAIDQDTISLKHKNAAEHLADAMRRVMQRLSAINGI